MVKIWNRQVEEVKPPRPKRIQNMEERDLRGWLNSSLMELGMTYDQWAFHNASPTEFTNILKIVNDLWDELQERTKHQ